MSTGGEDFAAFIGVIAIAILLPAFFAPPVCRMLAKLFLKHAAGIEGYLAAFKSEGKEENAQ